MKRHPICDELKIPEPKRADIDRIKADMEQNGWDPRFPSIVYQNRILAGNTREIAARELGIRCVRKPFRGTVEQAREFVIRSEVNRRHMTADEQKAIAEARRARAAELRAKGASTRTIAAETKVSQAQARRDLQAAGETGGSPDSLVKGKDGKTYEASKVDIRCAACIRKIPNSHISVKGCEACKRLKEEAKARSKGRTEPGTHEPAGKRGKRTGAAAYDFRRFHSIYGQLRREISVVERIYGQTDLARGDEVRAGLDAWKNDRFFIWFRAVSGTEAKPV